MSLMLMVWLVFWATRCLLCLLKYPGLPLVESFKAKSVWESGMVLLRNLSDSWLVRRGCTCLRLVDAKAIEEDGRLSSSEPNIDLSNVKVNK